MHADCTTAEKDIFLPTAQEQYQHHSDTDTDGHIPEIGEINTEAEFMAELITKEQFEKIYISDYYSDCIDFPK